MIEGSALRKLGNRLRSRRREAGIGTDLLSRRSGIPVSDIERFEAGQGGLGISALVRIADALGLGPGTFVHTDVPQVRASREPSILLKEARVASLGEPDIEGLALALRRARAFGILGNILGVERLDREFEPSAPPKRGAHRTGYDAARRVRALLPEREGPVRSLARLIENRFNIFVAKFRFSNSAILGASCRSGDAKVIAVNDDIPSEAARRFVLGHELGHHLNDLGVEGVTADAERYNSVNFWMENPPSEKRANAFSAMLLVSEAAVRSTFGPPRSEGYGLTEARALASRARDTFGIGFAAAAWHLYNLKYIRTRETVEALLIVPDRKEAAHFEEDTRFDGLERRVLEALARDLISRGRAEELLGSFLDDLEA